MTNEPIKLYKRLQWSFLLFILLGIATIVLTPVFDFLFPLMFAIGAVSIYGYGMRLIHQSKEWEQSSITKNVFLTTLKYDTAFVLTGYISIVIGLLVQDIYVLSFSPWLNIQFSWVVFVDLIPIFLPLLIIGNIIVIISLHKRIPHALKKGILIALLISLALVNASFLYQRNLPQPAGNVGDGIFYESEPHAGWPLAYAHQDGIKEPLYIRVDFDPMGLSGTKWLWKPYFANWAIYFVILMILNGILLHKKGNHE